MANTIRIKRSTGSSNPGSLENAEVAFREGDEVLIYGTGTGGSGGSATSIIPIGGKGAFFDKATTRTTNHVLAGAASGSAAAPTFRALVSDDIPSIAHTKISDFDAGVRTNTLAEMAAPAAAVSLNSQKITNLATPTAGTDGVNKNYVDGVAQGLDVKDSVKVATTANITLSGTQTIDGVAVSADERVLVKDQSTASQNGLYLCKASTWTRTDDLAAGADAAGAFAFVEQGTVNGDNAFVCSSDKGSAVTGTNNLTFVQFSGAGQVLAGDGLDKSGNTLSVDLKANGGLVIESTEVAVDLAASSITGTLAVGDGGTGSTSASAARTALGLAIGTNVQAFDAQLTDIAGLTPTDSNFIVGDGSNFVLESGATARASLGAQASATDLTNLSSCQSGGSAALAALTSTEIGILDGATLTTTELNYVDGVTSAIQTQLDAKQALDADLTALSSCQSGAATALALLTATEVAIIDGATVTTAELNILDGVTATTAEINLIDGGTSATSTTLAAADRFIANDNGTMKQVALSDLVTFLEDESASSFDIDGGSY
ncbi:phage related tail-fiber protein [uncultured Mediterranean phage uvMED]|nr:phage related tail-fiber protein [uncultured Mediterranean phage uvMED]BAR21612.1 phage-related tail fiber protein [uncultured Mediterranean phage uvMED]BAR21637.1 phage-related tail fiber protein [uncultured Mediterranean phage uvMED]BAR21694.1 phage-related tail fiber protein [uncultured Mediterranean phage uvMED]BAR21714.1 phage-related tail fiber protein [uncultured Mediterranean phage uvMED]